MLDIMWRSMGCRRDGSTSKLYEGEPSGEQLFQNWHGISGEQRQDFLTRFVELLFFVYSYTYTVRLLAQGIKKKNDLFSFTTGNQMKTKLLICHTCRFTDCTNLTIFFTELQSICLNAIWSFHKRCSFSSKWSLVWSLRSEDSVRSIAHRQPRKS